jgi:hypothetical protein
MATLPVISMNIVDLRSGRARGAARPCTAAPASPEGHDKVRLDDLKE